MLITSRSESERLERSDLPPGTRCARDIADAAASVCEQLKTNVEYPCLGAKEEGTSVCKQLHDIKADGAMEETADLIKPPFKGLDG
jgi:hypothetical protein